MSDKKIEVQLAEVGNVTRYINQRTTPKTVEVRGSARDKDGNLVAAIHVLKACPLTGVRNAKQALMDATGDLWFHVEAHVVVPRN